MKQQKFSRRCVLKGLGLALGTVFASPVRAAAPPAEAITPQLIEAARKEARVVSIPPMDLPVGEKLGKAFEAQYPGIQVQIERSGSERLFQRIDQEFAQQHPRRGCGQLFGCIALHHLEEERMAGAVRERGYGAAFPPRISRPRRNVAPPRGSICRRSPTIPTS